MITELRLGRAACCSADEEEHARPVCRADAFKREQGFRLVESSVFLYQLS